MMPLSRRNRFLGAPLSPVVLAACLLALTACETAGGIALYTKQSVLIESGRKVNCGISPTPTEDKQVEIRERDGSSFFISTAQSLSFNDIRERYRTSTPQQFCEDRPPLKPVPQRTVVLPDVYRDADPLTQNFARLLIQQSRFWLFNRLDVASVQNVRVTDGDQSSGDFTVRGDFTRNGGSPAWVIMVLEDNKVRCFYFDDFPGRCQTPGSSVGFSFLLDMALQGMAEGPTDGTGGASGPEEPKVCRQENIPDCSSGVCRNRFIEVCD